MAAIMNSLLMPVLAALMATSAASAQSGSLPGPASPCPSACPQATGGLCHFSVGVFFLTGSTAGLPDCIRDRVINSRPKEPSAAILNGIAELDAALQDRSGLQVTEEDLQVIRAGASISLARRQIQAAEYSRAAASLSDAGGRYHELRKRQLDSTLLVKVAAGLLRAGAPLESLAALAALPVDDPRRKYMAAEALFSMGDRSGAAEQYSEWLALKCASNAFMLTSDEYGEEHWTYLQRTGSGKADRCQALPGELRARLEALKLETGYLKSLPKTNDPPVLFHARADQ